MQAIIDTLHKAVVVSGIILALMTAYVAFQNGAPSLLMATAVAVTAAGYGHVKTRPAGDTSGNRVGVLAAVTGR